MADAAAAGDMMMMSSHEVAKMPSSSSSSLLPSPQLHRADQVPQGRTRTKRRRKKEKAGDARRKRRLTDEQIKFLEMRFAEEKKLECKRKVDLSAELGLEPKQVAVWFQNRRARQKSKLVEAAYLELKAAHTATVLRKCHLENEVLSLKERLAEVEDELKKLSLFPNGAAAGGSSSSVGGVGCEMIGSPSSSTLTTQPVAAPAANFGAVDSEAELMYISEYEYDRYIWSGYINY